MKGPIVFFIMALKAIDLRPIQYSEPRPTTISRYFVLVVFVGSVCPIAGIT